MNNFTSEVRILTIQNNQFILSNIQGQLSTYTAKDKIMLFVKHNDIVIFVYQLVIQFYVSTKLDLVYFHDIIIQFKDSNKAQEFTTLLKQRQVADKDIENDQLLQSTILLTNLSQQPQTLLKNDFTYSVIQDLLQLDKNANDANCYSLVSQVYQLYQKNKIQTSTLSLIVIKLLRIIDNSLNNVLLLRIIKFLYFIFSSQPQVLVQVFIEQQNIQLLLKILDRIIYYDTITCQVIINKDVCYNYLLFLLQFIIKMEGNQDFADNKSEISSFICTLNKNMHFLVDSEKSFIYQFDQTNPSLLDIPQQSLLRALIFQNIYYMQNIINYVIIIEPYFFRSLILEIEYEFYNIQKSLKQNTFDQTIVQSNNFQFLRNLLCLFNTVIQQDDQQEQIIQQFFQQGQVISHLFKILNYFMQEPQIQRHFLHIVLKDIYQIVFNIHSFINNIKFNYQVSQDLQETLLILSLQLISLFFNSQYQNSDVIFEQDISNIIQSLQIKQLSKHVISNKLGSYICQIFIQLSLCEETYQIYNEILYFLLKLVINLLDNEQNHKIIITSSLLDVLKDIFIENSENLLLVKLVTLIFEKQEFGVQDLQLLYILIKLQLNDYTNYLQKIESYLSNLQIDITNLKCIEQYYQQIYNLIFLNRDDLLSHFFQLTSIIDIEIIKQFLDIQQWINLLIRLLESQDQKLTSIVIIIIHTQLQLQQTYSFLIEYLSNDIYNNQGFYINQLFSKLKSNQSLIYIQQLQQILISIGQIFIFDLFDSQKATINLQDIELLSIQSQSDNIQLLNIFVMFEVLQLLSINSDTILVISLLINQNQYIITDTTINNQFCIKLSEFYQTNNINLVKTHVLQIILYISQYSIVTHEQFNHVNLIINLLNDPDSNEDFINSFSSVVNDKELLQLFEQLLLKIQNFSQPLSNNIGYLINTKLHILTSKDILELFIYDESILSNVLISEIDYDNKLSIIEYIFQQISFQMQQQRSNIQFYQQKISTVIQATVTTQDCLYAFIQFILSYESINLIDMLQKIFNIIIFVTLYDFNLQIVDKLCTQNNFISFMMGILICLSEQKSIQFIQAINQLLNMKQQRTLRFFQQEIKQKQQFNSVLLCTLVLTILNNIFSNTPLNDISEQSCTPLFFKFLQGQFLFYYQLESETFIDLLSSIINHAITISQISQQNYMVSCFENMIDALYSAVAVLNQSSCSQKNLYLSNGQNLTLNIQFLENFVLKTLQIVQSIVSCQPTFKVILTLGMLTLYSNIKIKNCSINLFEQIIQEKNFKHLIIYQQDCGVLGVPVFEVLKTFLLQEKDQSLIDKALSFLVRIFNSNDTQIHEICKKNWGQIYDSIKNLNSLECGKLMSLMK